MVKELEVKVLNIDMKAMEEKIKSLGGELITNELQVNTLIDSSKNPIESYLNGYLRIRETKDLLNNSETTTLTLKKSIKNTDIRENVELNTNIENKDVMLDILSNLGFNKIEIGHKKRISYILEGARIDLDTWDKDTYPHPYMEIEVKDKNDLERIINILEVDKNNISLKSIAQLKKDLKSK